MLTRVAETRTKLKTKKAIRKQVAKERSWNNVENELLAKLLANDTTLQFPMKCNENNATRSQ